MISFELTTRDLTVFETADGDHIVLVNGRAVTLSREAQKQYHKLLSQRLGKAELRLVK